MPRPSVGPFTPNTAGTVTIAATSSSAATALVGGGSELTLHNAGSKTVFVEQGISTASAAVATGFPVLAGAIITIGRAAGTTHIATICGGTDTTTLYASTGEGS